MQCTDGFIPEFIPQQPLRFQRQGLQVKGLTAPLTTAAQKESQSHSDRTQHNSEVQQRDVSKKPLHYAANTSHQTSFSFRDRKNYTDWPQHSKDTLSKIQIIYGAYHTQIMYGEPCKPLFGVGSRISWKMFNQMPPLIQ